MSGTSILLIDNYDSFTYNLREFIRICIGKEALVIKNDNLDTVDSKDYSHIIISPGPGLPQEAGQLIEFIGKIDYDIKVLGVCLGLQAIIEYYGGNLYQLSKVSHGEQTSLSIMQPTNLLWQNIPTNPIVGRYHSWVAEWYSLPGNLMVSSVSEEGLIMSISHKNRPIHAVQFHPESYMTDIGKQLLTNFLKS